MDVAPLPNNPQEVMSPLERVNGLKTRFNTLAQKRSGMFPGSRQSDSERPGVWNDALGIMMPLRDEIDKATAENTSFLRKVLPPQEVATARKTLSQCMQMVREELTIERDHLGAAEITDGDGSIISFVSGAGDTGVMQISLDGRKAGGEFSMVSLDADLADSKSLEKLKAILGKIGNWEKRDQSLSKWHEKQEHVDEELKRALSTHLVEHPTPAYRRVVNEKVQFQGFLRGFFERMKGRRKDTFLAKLVQSFVRSNKIAGGTVVDIGAGAGWESLSALQAGATRAVMLDISRFSLDEAPKRQKEAPLGSTIEAVEIDVAKDSFSSVEGGFTGAMCLNLLELLSAQERQHIIAEVYRNLATDGRFLVFAEEVPVTALLTALGEQLGDDWHALPKENTQRFPWNTADEKSNTSDILGLTSEAAAAIKSTAQLADAVQKMIEDGKLSVFSGIAWEGCGFEEMKVQLSNAGFIIEYGETGIVNPESRYSDGSGGRSNQFCIIALKPSAV